MNDSYDSTTGDAYFRVITPYGNELKAIAIHTIDSKYMIAEMVFFILYLFNAVLTGAGHEMPGNGAPYHRDRLKT